MFEGIDDNKTLKTWGKFIELDESLLLKLGSLKCNVIVFAHDITVYDEGGGRWVEVITHGTKMPGKFTSFFDEAYFAECVISHPPKPGGKREFSWITSASRVWRARTRTNLPLVIPQNFGKVFETYKIGVEK